MRTRALRLNVIAACLLTTGLLLPHDSAADDLPGSAVWTSSENGYHTYRIPSVIRAKSGDLLAFCEGRVSGRGDAGDIDLLMKRSADGGTTWSDQVIVWNDGAHTCGNPCPVIDESTGTIWLLLTHNLGTDTEDRIKRRTAGSTRTVWVCSSTNHGGTWTAPKNITATTKDPLWGWYATGPGIGIQIQHGPHAGRMIIPCDHSYDVTPAGKGNPFEYGAHVIYSDDHGATWQTGGTIRPHANECQAVELSDGKGGLLLNARSYFGRSLRIDSHSTDAGITWSDPQDAADLIEPVCQASLIRHRWPAGDTPGLLLFSNPADPRQRVRLTIRSSTDDGKHWKAAHILHEGPSAYSSLVSLNDSEAGCLFEAGTKSAYESIRFIRFPVSGLP